MGYVTQEILQFVKDVKEMGENLDIAINEEILEEYSNGSWLKKERTVPAFDQEAAILALWKNLDAFISKQIENIEKAQMKVSKSSIHIGGDGECLHHGKDTPYLKVLMGALDGKEHYEVLCVRCIADFLSHHTANCYPNNGRITFEGDDEPDKTKGPLQYPI